MHTDIFQRALVFLGGFSILSLSFSVAVWNIEPFNGINSDSGLACFQQMVKTY
jgi:hypothetical protein